MNFAQKLDKSIDKNSSLLCVGLDPDLSKIPPFIQQTTHPLFEFNKEIIDATNDLVSVYKPNAAFYEAEGAHGIEQLKMTCDYIHKICSDIPVLLDFKRGDIGNTNDRYCTFAFEYLGVEACTVQPYAGRESLMPFLKYDDKGIFVLCKTSNPGSGELQDLKVDGKPLYMLIAEKVVKFWNENGNVMLVVGATYPKELKSLRAIAGEMTFLVPGIGSQGGIIEASLAAGLNSKGRGLIINASRGIIYAGFENDFASKAREKALELRKTINKFR